MNRPENAREDFVNRADRHETPEQDSPETCTGETYTNVFVDLNDAGERPCGHDHTDPVAALECCLGRLRATPFRPFLPSPLV